MNRLFVTAAIATLALTTACGSDSNATTDGKSKTEAKAADRAEESDERTYESPLSEALGQPTDPSEIKRQAEAIEKEIQDCMAEEGFTYIPVPFDSTVYEVSTEYGQENDEWRSKYGFGIVEPYLNPETDLYGYESREVVENPNPAIVQELSEAEQRAYTLALDGYDPAATEDPVPANPGDEIEPKGCTAKAYADVPGWGGNPEVAELTNDLYETLNERIQADPRTKNLEKSWKKCANKAGFSEVKDPDDAYQSIQDQANEIAPDGPPPGGVVVTEEVVPANQPAPIQTSGVPSSGELSDEQIEKLKALQKREIALANAAITCLDENKAMALYDEVRIELEQQLVEERGSDFPKLR